MRIEGGELVASNNLSDLRDAAAARGALAISGPEANFATASMASGLPTRATSGQVITTYNTPSSSAPTITAGRLTHTTTSQPAAAYSFIQLKGTGVRIGARFRLTSGGANGVACLAFFAAPVGSLGYIPDSPLHLVSGLSTWSFGVWSSSGTWSPLASGTYPTALSANTDYVMEATIDRKASKCVIRLPNGTYAVVSDSRIGSLTATHACFESYQNDPGDSIASFDACWADSDPASSIDAVAIANAATLVTPRTYAMSYSPASPVSLSVPASTAAVDGTNFKLSVTPATTRMLVTMQIYLTVSTSTRYFVEMRTVSGSSFSGDTEVFLGVPTYGLVTVSAILTGLTPGTAEVITPYHWRTTAGVSALADLSNARRWSIAATDLF